MEDGERLLLGNVALRAVGGCGVRNGAKAGQGCARDACPRPPWGLNIRWACKSDTSLLVHRSWDTVNTDWVSLRPYSVFPFPALFFHPFALLI